MYYDSLIACWEFKSTFSTLGYAMAVIFYMFRKLDNMGITLTVEKKTGN